MSNGVIYWNSGTKLLVRLYVSLASLKEVYDGDITVILNSDVPEEFEKDFLNEHGFETKRIEVEVGHKLALVAKTMMDKFSPYDTTVYIDCDTLVLKKFDEMFSWTEEHKFVVTKFANWGTDIRRRPRSIARRIRQWGPEPDHGLDIISKEEQDAAHAYGHGINVGVFGFKKDASIFEDWTNYATRGQNTFIPDEVACQILLPKHHHFLAPQGFNSSCNKSLVDDDTRIIHYHGRKHANTDKTKNAVNKDGVCTSQLWINKLKELWEKDWCNIQEVRKRWPDRHSRWINL